MTMDASHLDDEALSALLDGALPDAAGQSHLAGCVTCAARREELAAARDALAGAPVEPVDEVTRRRMVATALEAFGPAGVHSRPWYQRPALAGGVAAVLLALFVTVPFVTGDDTTGGDEQAASMEAAAGEFLGDLGDVSDPAALRERFGARRTLALKDGEADAGAGAATGGQESAEAPMAPEATATAGPPYSAPAAAAPSAADSAAQNRAEGLSARDAGTGGLDRTVANACARTLAEGPASGSTLVAVATGTYEGTPAVVAVFDGAAGTTAFVAARDGCRLLIRFSL